MNIKGFVGKYISRKGGEDKGLVKPDETAPTLQTTMDRQKGITKTRI